MRRRPWKESEYESMCTSLDCESDVSTPLPERSVSSLSLAMVRSSWLPAADTFVRGVPALEETGVPFFDALAAFSACLFNLDALMGAMAGDGGEQSRVGKFLEGPQNGSRGGVAVLALRGRGCDGNGDTVQRKRYETLGSRFGGVPSVVETREDSSRDHPLLDRRIPYVELQNNPVRRQRR